ncbi:MAG: pyrroline-5-carboxylate reductase [Xanthobacteraceae bacterium]|nr:pyrroline-5-carboxylate reductase [Xanthobacteraceae bacterium]
MSQTNSLRDISGTLVLAGAGKMGSAMLDGWVARGLAPASIVVLEPQPSLQVARYGSQGLRLNPNRAGLVADAIIIAVKPQVAAEVLPGLAPLVGLRTVVVSIMAGRTLTFLESALPPATATVRTMPNTPAAIGRGITVAVGNEHVTPVQKALADRLLAATGAVEWITDERHMDAVTAVSGSGPAYVFLLAEALTRAGVAAGLPEALAEKLARVTVAGSGELLNNAPADAATLRQNVTSPGGTTAAALAVLMAADGLGQLMERAVAAATKRSRELA